MGNLPATLPPVAGLSKNDATLLIVRLFHTSARRAKKTLELLYSRQINVPGIILNFVDTSVPEYYYYQYSNTVTGV